MKTIILLLLVLSMLVVGCATKTTEEKGITEQTQTAEQASDVEVDNIVLSEDSEIEIGDMV